eukprot:5662371-Amphidinium_carterae.1
MEVAVHFASSLEVHQVVHLFESKIGFENKLVDRALVFLGTPLLGCYQVVFTVRTIHSWCGHGGLGGQQCSASRWGQPGGHPCITYVGVTALGGDGCEILGGSSRSHARAVE